MRRRGRDCCGNRNRSFTTSCIELLRKELFYGNNSTFDRKYGITMIRHTQALKFGPTCNLVVLHACFNNGMNFQNILQTDFINQTPSVSRALSNVLGPLCHTISQNPEEYSTLIRPIINAFIGFVSSTCEDTASAALNAIEPITELKTFDRNSNQNLITGEVYGSPDCHCVLCL